MGAWIASYQCSKNECETFYFGANMPIKELVAYCELSQPNLVIPSCTGEFIDSEARFHVIGYVKIVLPVCPILAWGNPFNG